VSNNIKVTVICGTDRADSNSLKVSKTVTDILRNEGAEAELLNLGEVNPQWLAESAYGNNVPELDAILNRYLRHTQKLVIVAPEYNGSFPGILKYLIDASNHGDWAGKTIALVGLGSGRGGNLRGVDHLTGIFHYLRSEVLSRKVYLSQILQRMDTEGNISDPLAITELTEQAKALIRF
jgi:chromate reductase, NAD(P)H dehydrogenase (quinone)